MGNKRINWVDTVRGVAIVLVVIGHTCNSPSLLTTIIYSFHMPLFFIISGYLFNFSKYENNFKTLLKNRFNRLILPAFAFSIILYIEKAILYLKHTINMDFLNDKLLNISHISNFLSLGGALWFLICLFFAELIFWLILHLTKNIKDVYKLIIVSIMTFCGIIIGKYFHLPLSLDLALVAQIFLFSGYILKENKSLEKISGLKFTIIFILLWIIDINFGGLSMKNSQYSNLIFSIIGAIAASIIMINSIKFLTIHNKYFCQIFSYLGKESIIIYCMQIPIISSGHIMSLFGSFFMVQTIFIIAISLCFGIIIKRFHILKICFYGETT